MGWAHCGQDSAGRDIGYAIEATCDHPGCEEQINRGISYACGQMHGENGVDCEKYFCDAHLRSLVITNNCHHGSCCRVCDECAQILREQCGFIENSEGSLFDPAEIEAELYPPGFA
jgi:hypothetical protein